MILTAQEWVGDIPSVTILLIACFVVLLLFPILFAVSRLGGWARLSRRFRATEPFTGSRWDWQSAKFRGWCNYNNCLSFGASPDWLYLSTKIPFNVFHPALMIPWSEVQVETGKMMFGLWDTAQFRIGTEEHVTVRIYGKLVNQIREAAGPHWPLYQIEQMERRCGANSAFE